MKITVKQGIIYINSVSVMQKTDTCVALLIDTKQKYPCSGGVGSSSNEDGLDFHIDADEETLRIEDPNLPSSIIRVEGLE